MTNKYFNYGYLEFTAKEIAEERNEDEVMFAVYCDETVEGEYPHDKVVGIFGTRQEAEDCVRTQNLLHSISQAGFYYNFRVEEICTLSKPKGVEKYQAEVIFYYFKRPQYDGKKFRSYVRIAKAIHKDGEVIFYEGNDIHNANKWKMNIFIDLDEKSTREEVVKRAKKLVDDYLINRISAPFE